MKKQILIITFFTLALIAGTSKSYGQLGPGITDPSGTSPQPIPPLSCIATSEPLHPFPGVSYTYKLDGSSGAEHAASYTWWATKDNSFVTGVVTDPLVDHTNFGTALSSPDVTNLSATYGATTAASTAGADEVTITWGASILANTVYQGNSGEPTFVVGYAKGENCADNIEVFEINPQVNFTIDIAPIDPDDDSTLPWDDVTADVCVDVVQSATYNNSSHALDMDYGENTIYFEVAAANFVTDWTPTFQIMAGSLAAAQTAVLELYPTLADAQAGSNLIGSASGSLADGATWASGIHLTATDATDIGTGVSVFVKVVIDNATEESLTSRPFVLAVDAQDDTENGIWDMEDDDCGVDVTTITADQEDQAQITILPRPQLDDATTPETMPNPDDVIIKTP